MPDLTGVALSRETATVLAASMAKATALKAAFQKQNFRARQTWCPQLPESSLTPPRRHPSSVETIAGRFATWKRAQASFRTRPRSISSLMLLTLG